MSADRPTWSTLPAAARKAALLRAALDFGLDTLKRYAKWFEKALKTK